MSASDASPDAVEVARANAARLGLPVDGHATGCRRASTTSSWRTCPTCARTSGTGWRPRSAVRAARGAGVGRGRARRDPRAGRPGARAGTRLALEHAPAQAEAVRGAARRRAVTLPRPRRAATRVTVGEARRDPGGRRDLRALHRRRRRGAVPGRHGLRARHRARLREGVERLYALKGRRPDRARRGDVLRARARAGGAARARPRTAGRARAAAARRA